jgi:hypothetical protein
VSDSRDFFRLLWAVKSELRDYPEPILVAAVAKSLGYRVKVAHAGTTLCVQNHRRVVELPYWMETA